MATTHTNQERTTDIRQASSRFQPGESNHFTRWLNVSVPAVGCVVIYAGVLFSAGLLVAYLAALIPGIAGVVVLLTVGPALIGAAPEIACKVCDVVLDVLGSYRTA